MDVKNGLTMVLIAKDRASGVCIWSEVCTCRPPLHVPTTPNRVRSTLPVAACLPLCYLPTEVTVVPLDGEICSNLGSIKGVKEEEDLCFWSVLLAD